MQEPLPGLIGTPAFVPGRQRSQLTIADRHRRHRLVVLETDHLIEAPNWSPDGRWMLYLSYPPGTLGHPANREVIIRIAPAEGGPDRPHRTQAASPAL